MSWVRIDDQYTDHPKIVEVGPLGLALHLAATCYCARYLTDGFVPARIIQQLINLDGIAFTDGNGVSNAVTNALLTNSLVRVGLFDAVPGGFMVHDYLVYNPSAAEVKAERAENAARQASWKAAHPKKRGGNAVSNGVSNAVTNALITASPTPTPLSMNLSGDDEFSKFQAICEKATGRPAIPADVQVINECIAQGAIEEDVIAAVAWYHAQGKVLHSIGQLKGSILYQVAKRMQAKTAATVPKNNGRKSSPPLGPEPVGVEGVGNPQYWPSTIKKAEEMRLRKEQREAASGAANGH